MAIDQKSKLDYKKAYRDLYLPKTKPSIVAVPSMNFITVAGTGDPNDTEGSYSRAMEILYGLSWTIKMSKMGNAMPVGYFEYVVPPLEGLWWFDGHGVSGLPIENKSEFHWISMIRQPEFVTKEIFTWAQEQLAQKKPSVEVTQARFTSFEEGLCAQIMHLGSYDNEAQTVTELANFIEEEGYTENISGQLKAYPIQNRHHEIYLNDPRKTVSEKLKTVIRHPIRKA